MKLLGKSVKYCFALGISGSLPLSAGFSFFMYQFLDMQDRIVVEFCLFEELTVILRIVLEL